LLTKHQLAQAIADTGAGGKNQVIHVLNALAEIAESEIARGEGITIPGVATVKYRYTSPRKKGQMYRKGETYTGFGGVEQVAEEDSKARKQGVKLGAQPAPKLKKLGKDSAVQKKAIARAKK
jgi:nucleoid DNA-binding protein